MEEEGAGRRRSKKKKEEEGGGRGGRKKGKDQSNGSGHTRFGFPVDSYPYIYSPLIGVPHRPLLPSLPTLSPGYPG